MKFVEERTAVRDEEILAQIVGKAEKTKWLKAGVQWHVQWLLEVVKKIALQYTDRMRTFHGHLRKVTGPVQSVQFGAVDRVTVHFLACIVNVENTQSRVLNFPVRLHQHIVGDHELKMDEASESVQIVQNELKQLLTLLVVFAVDTLQIDQPNAS